MDNQRDEAFEESYSNICKPIIARPYPRNENGEYVYKEIHEAYLMWQTAKAQTPQWISVNDHLPHEGQEVLVHSYGQICQATRDSAWVGGFKQRNCYGWQATYIQSHWMPKNIELPKEYHFYYENDAKQAQEQSHENG